MCSLMVSVKFTRHLRSIDWFSLTICRLRSRHRHRSSVFFGCSSSPSSSSGGDVRPSSGVPRLWCETEDRLRRLRRLREPLCLLWNGIRGAHIDRPRRGAADGESVGIHNNLSLTLSIFLPLSMPWSLSTGRASHSVAECETRSGRPT